MHMEIKVCSMDNQDGAWRYAKALLQSDANPEKQPSLRLQFYCDEDYEEDNETFVMVVFGDDCVAAAHVDLDMLLVGVKALKAFKNAHLSEKE